MSGPSEKIVGGEEAAPHQYPWMAGLFVDSAWFCGGTLISDQWVMTAGHCADGASHAKVVLGSHFIRSGKWLDKTQAALIPYRHSNMEQTGLAVD